MDWIKLISDAGALAIIVVSGKYIVDKIFIEIVKPLMSTLTNLVNILAEKMKDGETDGK